MALTEVYVDPSIAADSGTGTIGDPYGDLEYAIEQTTFDSTNGTRVNVKAGTAELLAANLNTALTDTVTTPAWAPTSATAPAIIQGYTAVAGDGGKGEIDAQDADYSVYDGTIQNLHFVDMKMGNTGAADVLQLGIFNIVDRCEVHTCDATYEAVQLGGRGVVRNCYIHDAGGFQLRGQSTGDCFEYNYIVASKGTAGMYCVQWGHFHHNIIVIEDTSLDGAWVYDDTFFYNNSIYSSVASTGSGIYVPNTECLAVISNNLIEGFSGTGGIGIEVASSTLPVHEVSGNALYNNTTNYSLNTGTIEADNEELSTSPFNDAANGDFSPVDTGNVLEGSLPQIIGMS